MSRIISKGVSQPMGRVGVRVFQAKRITYIQVGDKRESGQFEVSWRSFVQARM